MSNPEPETGRKLTLKEKRAKIERLIRIGRQMSNLCFNLSQNSDGVALAARHKQTMKELYEEWDKALREVRRVQP